MYLITKKKAVIFLKKLISILLVISLSAVFSGAAYASEPVIESYQITETDNGGYIEIDLNTNDTTDPEPLYGLQKATNLPAAYSSVEKGYITPVKNQSNASICWAFTTMSALEADVIRNFGDASVSNTAFSPFHLSWFTYIAPQSTDTHFGETYLGATASPFTIGGNWNRATATLANFRGIAKSSSVPENQPLDESLRYSTDSGYVIKDAIILDTKEDVKNWIMDHGGCYISYHHNSNYLNPETGAYYNTSGTTQNHAITVVGWDDNYNRSNFKTSPSSNGAWLCKNSFGSEFTQIGGYMWISYEDISVDITKSFFGFSAQKNEYYNNYIYNNVSFSNYFSMDNSVSEANVFTAKDDEYISAVAFQTMNKNLTAKIEIYTGIPLNPSTPVNGSPVSEMTTSVTGVGYHTISLNTPVNIKKGTRFSVVITLSGSGKVFLPIEKNNSGSASYTGNAGESFFKQSGEGAVWHDTYSYQDSSKQCPYRNVYVSALTKKELVHDLATKEVPATCTTDGYKKVYCKNCSYVESYVEYKATGHHHSANVTKPTCTAKGYTTHTCSCGDTYKDTYVNALGHNYVNGICSRCHAEDSEYFLNKAKAAAKSELQAAKTSALTENGKRIADTAITNINKAASIESVESIKAKALKEIKAENAIAEANPTAFVKINVASERKIDYRSKVIIKATATGVPEGYYLIMTVNGKEIKGTTEISYEIPELTQDVTYSVKIVDSKGAVQKDANGNDLKKDSKVSCDAGFFKKLVAFFKGLFKSLPTVEVKP